MKKTLLLVISLIFFDIIGYCQCGKGELAFISYFKENLNNLDPIEGIYSVTYTFSKYTTRNGFVGKDENPNMCKCAIIKSGTNFILCDLASSTGSGIPNSNFSSTSIEGMFMWEFNNTQYGVVEKANAKLSEGKLLQLSYKGSREEIIKHYEYAREQLNERKPSRYEQEELCRTTQLIHEYKLIKTFPTGLEKIEVKKNEVKSGTGFAISSKHH